MNKILLTLLTTIFLQPSFAQVIKKDTKEDAQRRENAAKADRHVVNRKAIYDSTVSSNRPATSIDTVARDEKSKKRKSTRKKPGRRF